MLILEILAKTGLVLSLTGIGIIVAALAITGCLNYIKVLVETWRTRDYAQFFLFAYLGLIGTGLLSWLALEVIKDQEKHNNPLHVEVDHK